MKYRIKKSIIHNLEKLIDKYGIDDVRSSVNKYFNELKEKNRLQKEIFNAEIQLSKLKKGIK